MWQLFKFILKQLLVDSNKLCNTNDLRTLTIKQPKSNRWTYCVKISFCSTINQQRQGSFHSSKPFRDNSHISQFINELLFLVVPCLVPIKVHNYYQESDTFLKRLYNKSLNRRHQILIENRLASCRNHSIRADAAVQCYTD